MSPQEPSCLDCDVNTAFPTGRHSACQVTRWPGANLFSRISPASANDQAPLLVLGSRRGCQLCPDTLGGANLENYQPCAPCVPTGSFLQAFSLAGHLTHRPWGLMTPRFQVSTWAQSLIRGPLKSLLPRMKAAPRSSKVKTLHLKGLARNPLLIQAFHVIRLTYMPAHKADV